MSWRTLVRCLRGDALDALAAELRTDRATVLQVFRDGLAANGVAAARPAAPAAPGLYAQLGHAGGIARIVDGDPQGIDGLYQRIAGSAWRSPDAVLLRHFRRLGPGADGDEGGWWRWLAWHLRRAVEDLARAEDPCAGQLAPGSWPADLTPEAYGRLAGHLTAAMADLGYPSEVRAALLERLTGLLGHEHAPAAASEGGKPEPAERDPWQAG